MQYNGVRCEVFLCVKLHGHKDVTLYELQGFGHSMTKPGHCILNKFISSVERKR